MGLPFLPSTEQEVSQTFAKNSTLQDARRRSHRTQEAQRWARRHRRQEAGLPRRAHEAPLGLHQEEQPPGPRQQAVLHPRQEDGQGLWLGEDARLRHGQVHWTPPLLGSGPTGLRFSVRFYTSTKTNKMTKTIKYLVSLLRS